jgi:ABC-type lipoprotein export system ATPase subunit
VTPSVLVKDVFRVHATAEGEAAALQGLSLEVQPEELLVVYGPSGSGKTSLLRLLAGLDKPSSGLVRVFGAELAHLTGRALDRYRAQTIGYLDQHYWRILSPELSIRELIGLRLALGAASPRAWRRRADELLEAVGLRGRGGGRPAELSGGEQQRVALCMAVAHRPRLLLADEPTGELDLRSAGPVYPLVRELARSIRCSAVVVTHDPRWSRVAARTVHIRDGRVSEERRGRVEPLLVVDEQGWVRLPEELRARAGIADRAAASVSNRDLVLRGFATPTDASRPSHPERSHEPGPVVAALAGVRKSYHAARRPPARPSLGGGSRTCRGGASRCREAGCSRTRRADCASRRGQCATRRGSAPAPGARAERRRRLLDPRSRRDRLRGRRAAARREV